MSNASLISFVARSKRRRETLTLLSRSWRLSQPEIMRGLKQYKSHNSRTLKELSDKGLIVCINPKDRAFKFYKITKKGKDVLEEATRIS
ncbi:MAG TPA: hypothetical protein HA282_04245 [Nanoarchaeota archaeon]|nr:hypothetical protein [Nanoarchaeota archaeon]HIH33726.1 hypothetical protein [Nanoarchaeota archaeon]HIH51185.1 hypothetical protein [Nanoarchaeota archaeon]HIH66397.1 hypothetical protein [Nanoarchaeota archaeon]